MNRKSALAFASWRFEVARQKSIGKKAGNMSRALLHLMNRQLSRGWSAWHLTWQALVAKRASLRRGLAPMLHRGLSHGWVAWVEMAMDRAIFMQKLRKGVSFMVNRKSPSASRHGTVVWDATTRCRGAELLAESRAVTWLGHGAIWAAAARKRASMKRGLAHLINDICLEATTLGPRWP